MVEEITWGYYIRLFFSDLLGRTHVQRLELEISTTRNDFEARINDLKLQLTELKTEKALLLAKVYQYESVLLPLSSRAGGQLTKTVKQPTFASSDYTPEKTSWQADQEAWEKMQDQMQAEEQLKTSTSATAA